MNTINNTAIVEARAKLLNAANEILKSGVPIAVIDLMIDTISAEVKANLKLVIQQETEESRIQSEQVEWTPETN